MKEKLIKKIQDLVTVAMEQALEEISKAECKLNDITIEVNSRISELNASSELVAKNKALLEQIEKKCQERDSESIKREQAVAKEEERLLNLREVINGEVETGKKKLQEIAKDISDLNNILKEQELKNKIENDARIKEIKEELERRLPEIEAREKRNRDKEKDLAVVESRWKKLFGEKGIGFKV